MIDFVGLAIVLALVLLFGFLALRAWGSRTKILKWVGVILAGLLTLIFALVFILALMGGLKANQNYNADHPVVAVKVAGTPEQIARGEKLANLCAGCHSDNGQLPLKGQDFGAGLGIPFGTLWAPNLTPAGEIKDWSDGEVIRAIREGVHHDGRSLIIMPAEVFRNLSDDDVQALVAYLRAQPAMPPANPPTRLNVIGNALIGTVFSSGLTVQPHITQPVTSPPPGTTKEYGEYLVNIIGCRSCHGQQLAGGAPPEGGPPTPNLTLVIPQWSEEQFKTFFRTGKLPSGQEVGKGMPWQDVSRFASDDDLRALYQYLHALTPQQ